MTYREICLKAAERLREVGWRQGAYGGRDGPHCMIGACRWAVGWYDNDIPVDIYPAHLAALAAARSAVFSADCSAAAWNDEPGRTVEEVIAALEACP